MSRIDQPRMIRALRSYFASGWAFLIPYQLAYLLYYWQQWPSNPGTETAAKTAIPSLLVVYWAMHALHIALALLACASAKSEEGKVKGAPPPPRGDDQGRALHRHQLRAISYERLATTARRLLSLFPLRSSLFCRPSPFTLHSSLFTWIALALLFYIPGVYLEFPADPLMHLRRITEWQVHEVVHWHTAGYKSLYFFAYSLVGWLAPGRLLFWTNLYHVAICLLLSWQYYRLARDAGLPKRWAQGFVLLHALLFGNFCFSFFRYYSLASTAFSQLGAIVLIRLTITWAKNHRRSLEPQRHKEPTGLKITLWPQRLRGSISDRIRLIRGFIARLLSPLTLHHSLFVSALCAALLVVNNHVQGLGIAALGCASVIAWKIVRWPGPRWKGWLILSTLLTTGSLAVYYGWPRSPKFEAVAMEPHWLTSWQGLNFFPPDGTAYPRSIAILGMMGVLNLLAGIYLCLRRQMIGWLTVGPILLLALPLTAVPLADNFARGHKEIITFTRMFFSIPAGLALAALLRELILRRQARARPSRFTLHHSLFSLPSPFTLHPSLFLRFRLSAFVCLLSALLLFTILPASHPWQNHFWHALARPPADLSFTQESAELAQLVPVPLPPSPFTLLSSSPRHPSPFSLQSSFRPPRIGSTTPITRLLNAQAPFTEHVRGLKSTSDKKANAIEHHYSVSVRAPADDYMSDLWPMGARLRPPSIISIPETRLYTPYSQAAQSSVHWNAADALFATTGMPELEALAQTKGLIPKRLPSGMILWEGREE